MLLVAEAARASFVAATRAVAVAADPGNPTLNTTGIVEWGVKNIIPILLLFVGIVIIARARKGQLSDNANILVNVLLGMGVIAGAAVLYGFAGSLTHLIFGA